MKPRDVKKVLLAARKGPYNQVVSDLIPGWSYAKLSAVIGYCFDKNYVHALDVQHMQSPHPEFILQGITSDGEDFLESQSIASITMRLAKTFWALIATAIVGSAVTALASDRHKLLDKLRHLFH